MLYAYWCRRLPGLPIPPCPGSLRTQTIVLQRRCGYEISWFSEAMGWRKLPVVLAICLLLFTQCVSHGLVLTMTCIAPGFTVSWFPTCWTLEVKRFIVVPSTIMLIFQYWIWRETIQNLPSVDTCILSLTLSLQFYHELWNPLIKNLLFVWCVFYSTCPYLKCMMW